MTPPWRSCRTGTPGKRLQFHSTKSGAVRKVCRCEPVTDVTGVAAPRLNGNSLALLPRCLKIRGIATPACALVRNDRAFSNSPQIFSCVSGFPGDRSGSPGAWGLRPPRCLAWVLPFSLPSRHFSPSGVSPVRICRTGGLYSAASSKRGFTFWRYSLAKSRPVTRADMTSAMGKDHQTLSTLPVRLSR